MDCGNKCTIEYFIALESEFNCNFIDKCANNFKIKNTTTVMSSITDIINDFKDVAENKGIFIIFCMDLSAGKWTNINIVKSNLGEITIDINHSLNNYKEKSTLKAAIRSALSEDMVKDIPLKKVVEDNKEAALQHMKYFIKTYQKLLDQSIEHSETYDISNKKSEVQRCLSDPITTKRRLDNIVLLLNEITEIDSKYTLDLNKLQNFSAILTNPNFQFDLLNDTKDLRLEVIKLLRFFKSESNGIFENEKICKYLEEYFIINKNKYKNEIIQSKKKLEKLDTNEILTSTVKVIQHRLEFIRSISELAPNILNLYDIDEFISTSVGGVVELKELVKSLESDLNKADSKLPNHLEHLESDYDKNAYNQRHNPYYLYQAQDFYTLKKYLFDQYKNIKILLLDDGKNKVNSYDIVYNDIETANKILRETLQDLSKPILVYFNISNIHWICFAAFEFCGKVYVLYKDSLGIGNDELENLIVQILGSNKVIFLFNTLTEQTEGSECGIFALVNMQIIAEHLVNDDRQTFISEFPNYKHFCDLIKARDFRKKDFAMYFVLGKYYEVLNESINMRRLKVIRNLHFKEAEELAFLLAKQYHFHNTTIIAMKDDKELDTSCKNTIFIAISTDPETLDHDDKAYIYFYRFLFSNDFTMEKCDKILDCLESILHAKCNRDCNIFNANEISCINKVSQPNKSCNLINDELATFDLNIGDYLDLLYVSHSEASTILELLTNFFSETNYDKAVKLYYNTKEHTFFINKLKEFITNMKNVESEANVKSLKIKMLTNEISHKYFINANTDICSLIKIIEKFAVGSNKINLSKETLEVLAQTNINDIHSIKTLLKIFYVCDSLPSIIKEFTAKAIFMLSAEDFEFILEVNNLFDHEVLIKFVNTMLLTSRNISKNILELLKPYDISDSRYFSLKLLVNFVHSYRSCKEFLSIPKNLVIVEELIDCDQVPIFFIEDFKSYIKDCKLDCNSIKIGEFLIKNGQLKLEDFGWDFNTLLDSISTDVYSAVLNVIYQDLIFTRKIDPLIISKLEIRSTKKNANTKGDQEKVKNILDLVEQFSEILILLKNPRENIFNRKIALNSIQYATPHVVNVLTEMIKYENDLRDNACQVLLNILPNDSVFNIEFAEINFAFESFYTYSYVDHLIKLCKNTQSIADKQTIFNILIKIACTNTFDKQESLQVFSKLDLELLDLRCLSLPEDEWAGIKKLRDFPEEMEKMLLNIEENINEGFTITEDKINALVKHFQPGNLNNNSKIGDALLAIELHQGLKDTSFIYEVPFGTELFELQSISQIIVRDICKGKKVGKEALLFIISKPVEEDNLISLLDYFVSKKNTPPTSLLNFLSHFLDKSEKADFIQIELLEIIYQVICNCKSPELEISENLLLVLKKMSLRIRENFEYDDYLINHAAFKSLKNVFTISRSEQFLKEYFISFKKRTFHKYCEDTKELVRMEETQVDQIFNPMEKFDNFSPQELYLLYEAINSNYSQTQELKIDFSTPPHLWRQNILKETLLEGCLRSSNFANSQALYIELGKFNTNLVILNDYLNHINLSSYSFPNVLQALVNKQQRCKFSLRFLNDILTFISSNQQTLPIIFQASDNRWYSELRKLWLTSAFAVLGIDYREGFYLFFECTEFFSPNVVYDIIHKLQVDFKIDKLITFFDKLRSSCLDFTKQEEFLLIETRDSNDPDIWIIRLHKNVAKKLLDEKIVCENLTIGESDIFKLCNKFSQMLSSGWVWPSVKQLISHLNKSNISSMISALDPIYEYQLQIYEGNLKYKDLLSIFQTPHKMWQMAIHDLAISKIFTGSYDKKVEELYKEISELNHDKNVELFQDVKLMLIYQSVLDYYNAEGIKDWKLGKITEWAKNIKKIKPFREQEQIKVIAIIKRAVELTGNKYSPRVAQILALIILLNPEKDKGRLSQINTGEGKTTIIAMLAAIKALEGNTVDIITSSPELAKPQSREQEDFFCHLGLTVSHNCKNSTESVKESYKANILYGAAENFQGDILRNEYNKSGVRCGRKFDVAIIDEVDSMLIDSRNHIVMLSAPMPAMDHLEALLAAIWIQIQLFSESITEIGADAYYVVRESAINECGRLIEGKETLLPIKNKVEFIKNGTRTYIRKLLRDFKHLPKHDEEGNSIEDTLFKQDADLKKFEERSKSDLNFQDEQPIHFPRLHIPKHLEEFITEVQIEKWIENALYAFYKCQENKHYVIRGGRVLPVDATNTGVVQQNMNWSDGLHQFLQIKHGAKITPENITTNFISNVSFFRRYKHNIFGLTGTLGGNGAQKLLNKTYNVDCITMPLFRKKQYKELTSIITSSFDNWYDTIVENSINKLNNGRGVLVITKYIQEVDEIRDRLLKSGYNTNKIKIYKTDNDSRTIEELKEKGLKPGEIIIATNIAGRGTDIKITKEVEMAGGLHVCVTFLPPNERIAKQNEGRVARAGERGTGQFILIDKSNKTIHALKRLRDQNEEKGLRKAEKEVEKITNKDLIFSLFCSWLDEIGVERNNQTVEKKTKFKDLEEQFGLWLKLQNDFISNCSESDIKVIFEKFQKNMTEDSCKMKNPSQHIFIGNKYIIEKKYDKAIEEFDKAISIDPQFAVNAFYNRGYSKLAKFAHDTNNNIGHINSAISDLRRARQIIEEVFEPMIYIIQKASNATALSEQVNHKFTLYSVQKSIIESAVGIGIAEMNYRQTENDRKLNRKINEAKVLKKQQELTKNCDDLALKLSQFEKSLPMVTESERNSFRKKDIYDSIKARKMVEEETKINEEAIKIGAFTSVVLNSTNSLLPSQVKKYLPSDLLAKQRLLELKKDAFHRFKNGLPPKPDQENYFSEFNSNTIPSEKEIDDMKADISAQDEILEKGIVGKCLSKGTDMEVKLIDIKETLPQEEDITIYEDEIKEFQNNGFMASFQVSEIKPINWGSVIGVAFIGLAQLVAGGALTVFSLGAGASVGLGLISEGVSDLITAVKDGIINRDFDWKSYGIQKAISITVSLVCAGFGAIKDAAKTAVAGVKQAFKGAIKGITEIVKEGWKIAAKAIGISLSKSIAKEVITTLIDYGVNKALMPSIQIEIQKRIEKPIQNALLDNFMVKELLKLDGKNRTNKYQHLIKQKAMEILYPEQNQESALFIIAKGIAEGIAKNKIPGVSMISQITDAMNALGQLNSFVTDFITKLNISIEKIHKDAGLDKVSILTQTVSKQILSQIKKRGNIDKELAYEIENSIKNTLSSNVKVQEMLLVDSKNGNNFYEKKIEQKIKGESFSVDNFVFVLQKTLDRTLYSDNAETEPLTSKSNDNMSNASQHLKIDNNDEGINLGSNYLKEEVFIQNDSDVEIDVEIDQDDVSQKPPTQVTLNDTNSSPDKLITSLSKSVSGKMSDILEGRLIKKFTSGTVNYGIDKFAAAHDHALQEQLGTYTAKRRLHFMVSGDTDNRVPSEFKQKWVNEGEQKAEAMQLIDNLENGGEAGLLHLGTLSNLTGQPIAIYDEDENLVDIIGEDKTKPLIKIKYLQNPDGTGHWEVPGKPEQTQYVEKNNCLFAAVAAQSSEKNPDALRSATAEYMRNNIDHVAHLVPDMQRVAQYEKVSLREGGAKKDENQKSALGEIIGNPRARFVFTVVEGNSIAEGGEAAHAIQCHVGRVDGKSSFKDKTTLINKYNEVLHMVRTNSKDVKVTIRELPGKNGTRKVITARVPKFDGYESKLDSSFKYVKIVMDKPNDRKYYLPQTCYPCKKP